MTRQEHLDWAKQRALDYLNSGDFPHAFHSMLSDLSKHDELKEHSGIRLGLMLKLGGYLNSHSELRSWITGFN